MGKIMKALHRITLPRSGGSGAARQRAENTNEAWLNDNFKTLMNEIVRLWNRHEQSDEEYRSLISQTAKEILLEVSRVDTEVRTIASRIEINDGAIEISADYIHLQGVTTVNGHFKINAEDGKMEAEGKLTGEVVGKLTGEVVNEAEDVTATWILKIDGGYMEAYRNGVLVQRVGRDSQAGYDVYGKLAWQQGLRHLMQFSADGEEHTTVDMFTDNTGGYVHLKDYAGRDRNRMGGGSFVCLDSTGAQAASLDSTGVLTLGSTALNETQLQGLLALLGQ